MTQPYRCLRTPHAPTIDGRLDEPVWQRVPRSPRFVDMLTGEPAHFDTRAAAVWDDQALGTIYEVFFIWQDAYARFDPAEFDIHRRRASTFGGNFDRDGLNFWRGTHPRGVRWAFTDWDFPGLRSAVHIDGALNDRQTVSRGWTVELSFPWAGMAPLAHGRSLPPRPGDEWRLFFGRFEHLTISGQTIHPAWSWHPIGSPDTHTPERFTPVVFDAALA